MALPFVGLVLVACGEMDWVGRQGCGGGYQRYGVSTASTLLNQRREAFRLEVRVVRLSRAEEVARAFVSREKLCADAQTCQHAE